MRGLSDSDVRLLDTFEGDVSADLHKSILRSHDHAQEYVRATVPVHPLGPFSALESAARDAALVPTTPPLLAPEFLAGLPRTHPALPANTYLWIKPLAELKPDIWDYAEFVRDNAWKWVGRGAVDNEYYTEVDHRREMDGNIVRREIVSVEGRDSEEKRVVVEIDTQ